MSSDVSAFPGPYRYWRTPYLKEVVNCLSPDHPSRRIAVMKGAQIGFSAGVIENGIGYIISEAPGPILFMAGTPDLTKQAIDTRVDQMIDSCGLRDYIRPNVVKPRNQRTGDTSDLKEFSGGFLKTISSNFKGLRQLSAQYGFMDDFEAVKRSSEEAGSTTSLIEKRFASYYSKMKLFFISTPETKQMSNIEPAYLLGDQRRYHVPCPCCGDYIVLEWSIRGKDGETFGIHYKLDKNNQLIPGSVGYVCQSCGEFFDDSHKQDMNVAGRWIPTAKPSDPTFYSFHISSLYAPPGMYDWEYYVTDYLKACPPGSKVDVMLYKTFVNTVLGKTWEERGEKPNASKLSRNTRSYPVSTIPNSLSNTDNNGNILMVTCACDLNGIVEDARLDYEIVAWSKSGVSYSIEHGSIGTFVPGESQEQKAKSKRKKWTYEFGVENSVWPLFTQVIEKSYKTDEDSEMTIQITGVDTGHYTSYAYDFMTQANDRGLPVVGLKGDSETNIKFRLLDKNTPLFRPSQEKGNLYLVETNLAKDTIAKFVKLNWNHIEGSSQPWGFMNFPTPSGGKYTMKSYFDHYQSEHKVVNKNTSGEITGYKWVKRNSAVMNHLFDCRVYNMACRDIMVSIVCKLDQKTPASWEAYCEIIEDSLEN